MKSVLRRRALRFGAVFALPIFVFVLVELFTPFGRSDQGPVLVGGPWSNGYFQVTITNGTPNGVYEIYEKYSLDADVPWSGSVTGAPGQTSFWYYAGPSISWFFKAIATNDLDGDGIENYRDADPNNPTNNASLAITIVSPTNNATLQ
jgi:hypothetical protein